MMTENNEEKKLPENEVEYEFSTPDKQEARAFLRERFLRVMTGVIGKQAKFHMHENTKVNAEFRGCDVDCLEIFARNLETPLGKVPEAILRATDVICIEINGITTQS
ncbi:gem-associated protein 7-like [Diprion similis]|uniref:gem-associated protein 7-like n=1 Tax=Diprion similis TaxID=362088 RepID=UPI001EF80EEE|nr:gem-associated protein 7-like [Diprion similis]